MRQLIMTGGLGNQMFQYAFVLSRRDKGEEISLDTSLYNYTKMHNGFELNRVFSISEDPYCGDSLRITVLRILLRVRPRFLLTQESFSTIPAEQKLKRFIKGEFQSEVYFKNVEDIVRDTFVFKDIDSKNLEIADKIRSSNSVSVHFRRGDYLNNPLYEGICTRTYYQRAISEMLCRHPDSEFYVFSNDVPWSRSFFESCFNDVKRHIVDINSGTDSYQDMFLMSQCRHNIIANSSFSWWGAWLNRNISKVVIAPKIWMNTSEEYYKYIVPTTWIKM